MKRLLIIVLAMAMSLATDAQDYTQKYNRLMERTEFYDSYGSLIGWAKYNSIWDRMEYFDKYGRMVKYEEWNRLF